MSAAVRFVFVEPREAGNVGAAARAMKNFGFTEMVLVGELPALEPVATWWASGAEDLVAAAARFATLDEALADVHIAVATTSSRARLVDRPMSPAELAALRASLEGERILAIVFGREDRGLTAEELARCGRTAVIPTSDLHAVMNLAQAVAVFGWELSRPRETAPETRDLATFEALERFHEAARSLLLDAGFLDPVNPDRVYDDLRAIAARSGLDPRELTILMGIIRQIRWKLSS